MMQRKILQLHTTDNKIAEEGLDNNNTQRQTNLTKL